MLGLARASLHTRMGAGLPAVDSWLQQAAEAPQGWVDSGDPQAIWTTGCAASQVRRQRQRTGGAALVGAAVRGPRASSSVFFRSLLVFEGALDVTSAERLGPDRQATPRSHHSTSQRLLWYTSGTAACSPPSRARCAWCGLQVREKLAHTRARQEDLLNHREVSHDEIYETEDELGQTLVELYWWVAKLSLFPQQSLLLVDQHQRKAGSGL